MKRPVLPLNIPEYIAKTGHLTTVQHGAYLLLIMHYWTHGGLPDDEKIIQQITRLTNRQWFNNLNILRSYFLDHWRHKRLDEDLAQAIEISDKRSASAMQMHSKRNANASTLHTSHIQRKTVNGFEGSKKEEIGGFKARPGSPEFLAWSAWAIDTDKKIFSKELKQRELEGRPFDFETQWPPQHQNGI